MAAPNAYPLSFTDIKVFAARVHKVEFTGRVLLMEATISLHGGGSIRAAFDNGYTIKLSVVVGCRVGF
jgi:hypothetical protein